MNDKIIDPINYMRLKKKTHLPYEQVDLNSISKTKEFREDHQSSCMKQNFSIEKTQIYLKKQPQ